MSSLNDILSDFAVVINKVRPKLAPEPKPEVRADIGIENLKLIEKDAAVFYQRMRSTVLSLSARARGSDFTKKELVDISYLLRETRGQFEEIRKDLDANKNLIDRICCLMVLTDSLAKMDADDSVRTLMTTAKPKYSKTVTLPKKDTIEHQAMMNYFGISIEGQLLGVADVSWKRVCAHVTQLCELGKPVPNFLPKVFDTYAMIHRTK
jgi:hypothetical protein